MGVAHNFKKTHLGISIHINVVVVVVFYDTFKHLRSPASLPT